MSVTQQKATTQTQERKSRPQSARVVAPASIHDLFGGSALPPVGDPAGEQIAMLQQLPAAQQVQMLQRVSQKQGNWHAAHLVSHFRPPAVQTQLTVNEPDDAYEQEADAVADAVMRMSSGSPADEPPPDDEIQRKENDPLAGSAVTPDVENRVGRLEGGGEPLPDTTRSFFEERMGADFGDVRIHRDAGSAELSQDLNARAFTVGNNIAFNNGEYSPDTNAGKHLLAHELTHTIQQGAVTQRQADVQRRAQDEQATETEDDLPTPEEKAAALAAAAQAEQEAQGHRQTGQAEKAKSQEESTAKQAEGSGFVAIVTTSIAQGPVNDEQKRGLEQKAAENTAIKQAASAEQKSAAEGQVEAVKQNGAAAPPAATFAPPALNGTPALNGGGDLAAATPNALTAFQQGWDKANNAADKAPESAEADPQFAQTIDSSKAVAEKERTHDPAQGEADEAQAAAESPQQELESQAQSAQVTDMEQAETPGFDAADFKARLMERIAALAPQTAEEADNFKESGQVDALNSGLQGDVDAERQESEDALEDATSEGPDMGDAQAKPVTPLDVSDAGAATLEIGAEQATPKPKAASEVEAPLQAGGQALDQQLADAEITEEQLANANEPEFSAALEAKKGAQASVEPSAQAYRQGELGEISSAEAEAVATAQTALQGMHDTRTDAFAQVDEGKTQTKSEDEQAREKIASDIDAIYERTQASVTDILNRLDGEVQNIFNQGADAAATAFENYVDRKMEAYKEERYGGMFGWGKWLKDKVAGMPSEVNAFYSDGRQLYIEQMDAVIDNIVSLIGRTLAEAKAEVANGKQEIQTYVEQLPQDLQAVGQEAANDIQSRFDQLEQSIDDKQGQLIDTLAQQYSERLQAIDTRIEELQAENRGLVQMAIDAVGGVIETVIRLKNMLLEVLASAAAAVTQIIQDPIGFLSNLIAAISQGFENFVANIGQHLQTGLINWLTGAITEAGITMPESFDLQGIFQLVIQILGVSFEQIIGKFSERLGVDLSPLIDTATQVIGIYQEEGFTGLVQAGLSQIIGEDGVDALMQVVDVVQMVMSGDFGQLWELVKEHLSGLKELVMGKIGEFISERVIKAGITWILSLFNPAGAFIRACMMIYDVVMFFVERGQQIMALVQAIIGSIVDIASGNIGGAAAYIEQTLARAIPVVISFLSSLLGLGDISGKVQEIIQSVRDLIDRAIDAILDLPPVQMVIGFIRRLIDKIMEIGRAGLDRARDALGLGGEEQTSEGEQIEDDTETEYIDSAIVKSTFSQAVDVVDWAEDDEVAVQRMPLYIMHGGVRKQHTLEQTEAVFNQLVADLSIPQRLPDGSSNPDYSDLRDTIFRFHEENRTFNSLADLKQAAIDGLQVKQQVRDVDWDDPDVADTHPEKDEFLDLFKTFTSPAEADAAWNMTIEGIQQQRRQNAAGKKHDLNQYYADLGQSIAGFLAGIPPVALWSGGIDTSLYARAQGYTTLEATGAGRVYDALKLFRDFSTLGPLWNNLSRQFVRSMTGEVHVFMRVYNPQSVLFRQELPELSPMIGREVSSIKWHVLRNWSHADLKEVNADGDEVDSYTFNSYEEAVQVLESTAMRDENEDRVDDVQAEAIKEELRVQLLTSLPTIGEGRASAIVSRFSTMMALRNASIADLESIPSIGSQTAAKVFGLFH